MLKKITPRMWNLIVVFCCASLVGFALYNQYVDYLDPCPLCIFQRVIFMAMGAVALLAALHNPARLGQQVYGWLLVTGATIGALIAGRHVWLQGLPPDEVPECGPGLNYMLENFPVTEVLSTVLRGSGSCAEVLWTFMGMSMPKWTLIWYVVLGLVTLWVIYRPARN
jgi:disulfide bond formation protein DsbB